MVSTLPEAGDTPGVGRDLTGPPAALVVLLLGSTLVVMAGAVLAPVLALIRVELALTGTAAGLVLTTHALALAVASPAVGWLIDRCGVRGPLAAGLVLYGVAGGAGLATTSYPALLASRVVFGLGAAAVFAGTTVALLDLYQGPQRDRVMGWRSTATSLGGVLWPLAGGALGGLSWHAPFGVYLLGIPLGVATLLTLPTPRVDSGHEHGAGRDAGGDGSGGVVRLIRERPRILGLFALLATGTLLLYGLLVFLPLRLAEIGVRAPFLVAVVTVSMSAAMSLTGLVYARVLARLGYGRLLRATYLAWGLSFALLASTDRLALVVLAQALFGAGMGLAIPALTVLLGEAAPPRLRGQVTALSGTAIFLGQFSSPLLLGPVVDATSIPTGFLAAAALAGGVLLALLATDLPARTTARARTGDRR